MTDLDDYPRPTAEDDARHLAIIGDLDERARSSQPRLRDLVIGGVLIVGAIAVPTPPGLESGSPLWVLLLIALFAIIGVGLSFLGSFIRAAVSREPARRENREIEDIRRERYPYLSSTEDGVSHDGKMRMRERYADDSRIFTDRDFSKRGPVSARMYRDTSRELARLTAEVDESSRP